MPACTFVTNTLARPWHLCRVEPATLGPMARHLFRVALGLLMACGSSSAVAPECESTLECAPGLACFDGECRARSDAGSRIDAGMDAGVCAPGQLARAGGCLDECAHPDALACAEGDVCDVGAGRCVASGTPGIVTGEDQPCGEGVCRPGTECSVDDACEPIPACGRMSCTEDGTVCWGRSCTFARPEGGCVPASLDRLNQDDFLLGGDGGAFDLEFDDACNAYAVTMISGTDYLRQLAPDGTLTVWDGVTNLNMGEVAVLRAIGGEFGSDDDPGEVALTYICCASCGCVGTDPQGVARLDRDGASSLPMVVEATPSTGAAPWGSATLDSGPYGLTWGRDRTLYVGNVTTNGDLVRASLADGTSEELHRFDARVVATAVFGRSMLLVALEGGAIFLASSTSAARRAFASVEGEVTAMVRDPLTGHVFVSLAGGDVLELSGAGEPLGTFLELGASSRIAYAPDGFLYALDPGFPRPGRITRHALPGTRE